MSKKPVNPPPAPVPVVKTPRPATLTKYGLVEADWHRLCAACNYTCVVCGKPFEDRPLVIDHEHVKGFKARKKRKAKQGGHTIKVRVMTPAERRKYVRGVIHNYCNRFVRSWLTLPRARAIVAYLEEYERTRADSAPVECNRSVTSGEVTKPKRKPTP